MNIHSQNSISLSYHFQTLFVQFPAKCTRCVDRLVNERAAKSPWTCLVFRNALRAATVLSERR